MEQLLSIQQTTDGGYILGGSSNSRLIKNEEGKIIGNKQEDNRGSFDYWVIKLDAEGQIEWEKTLGGKYADLLKNIVITEDGYLLGGTSNSNPSSDKVTANLGMNDFWLVKLNLAGEEEWQQSYGGEGDDELYTLLKTEKGYLVAGSSNSNTSDTKKSTNGNGTDFWLLAIDEAGNTLWDKTYDYGKWDILQSLVKTDENNYLIGGYAASETLGRKSDAKGINDYIALSINPNGEMLWSKTLGGAGNEQLKKLIKTRDGGFILVGNSDSKKSDDKDQASIGGNDYWLVKLKDPNKTTEDERKKVEVYPNPTYQYANVVISQDFTKAKVEVYDLVGRKLQTKDLRYRSTPIDLQGYTLGVYLFKITIDNNQTYDIKVLKKGSK